MAFPTCHSPFNELFIAPFQAFIGMTIITGITNTVFHTLFRIDKPENVGSYSYG